jgi:hypothetical protein
MNFNLKVFTRRNWKHKSGGDAYLKEIGVVNRQITL